MRGMFVTDENAPQGPQLTTAPVTETLLLQAPSITSATST